MAEKVLTKKTFIGGRLAYPGEIVDVDAKGQIMPAASTPIGQLTVDQLRTALAKRESEESEPVYGANVADPKPDNTGEQPLRMAPIAPSSTGAINPQVAPAGSEETAGGFVHRAPQDAEAAVERVLPAEYQQPAEAGIDENGKDKQPIKVANRRK